MNPTILIVSGTSRPGSNARKISDILHGFYQSAGVSSQVYSLDELPPDAFLPSVYASKPPAVQAMQQRVLDAGGLHVVTPEYNGGFPGVLKHWIDLLKFPESFEHKPVAFVGESAGTFGGLRPVEQLQQVFGYRNAHIYPVRVFIPGVHGKLNAEGQLTDPDIAQRLKDQCTAFANFVTKVKH